MPSRLERSNEVPHNTEPFRSLGADRRARIIAEQTLIVDFATDVAITALPSLIPLAADRGRAIETVQDIAGDTAAMSETTLRMLVRLRETLQCAPLSLGAAAREPAGKKAKAHPVPEPAAGG